MVQEVSGVMGGGGCGGMSLSVMERDEGFLERGRENFPRGEGH